jgi:DNA-binding NarL/FixJ family response regulator
MACSVEEVCVMETGYPIPKATSNAGTVVTSGSYYSHSTRVWLMCNHRLLAAALRDHLAHYGLRVFQSFENETELLPGLSGKTDRPFDVVVLPLMGPASSGLEQIRQTLELIGPAPLVVLAENVNRGEIYSVLRAGAKALVSIDTDPEDLRRAINMVCRGKIFLSADVAELVVGDIACAGGEARPTGLRNVNFSSREAEIVRLLWDGLSTKEIGQKLHVSFKTVENHRYNIYQKCGASNLAALFRYAVHNAIVAV